MRPSTFALITIIGLGCAEQAAQQTDPGTQIGGVDCDYSKLLLDVQDPDGAPIASAVTLGMPSGTDYQVDCPAFTCNVQLGVVGTYTIAVDAGEAGSRSTSFVVDDSTKVGTLSAECGGGDVHEVYKTIKVVASDGGGDIFTSNIGLHPVNSAGDPQPGDASVTVHPSTTPYTVPCISTRCWIDIEGMGTYDIDYIGSNGEKGSTTVVVTAADFDSVNELGHDTYEVDVVVNLAP